MGPVGMNPCVTWISVGDSEETAFNGSQGVRQTVSTSIASGRSRLRDMSKAVPPLEATSESDGGHESFNAGHCTMATPKILLTGATGYVGGTILHRLVTDAPSAVKKAQITALVRGEERAKKLQEVYGNRITCVLFNDWNQSDFL
jgi:hypothetical protein